MCSRFVFRMTAMFVFLACIAGPLTAQRRRPANGEPASQANSDRAVLYRDPGGKFTFEIPEGWNVAQPGTLLYGTVASFSVNPNDVEPAAAIQNLKDGLTKQFIGIDVQQVDRGESTLAGRPASYITFTGAPGGVDWRLKVIVSKSGWMLIELTQVFYAAAVDPGFAQMEHSFKLTSPGQTAPPDLAPPPTTQSSSGMGQNQAPQTGLDYRPFFGARVFAGRAETQFMIFFPDGTAIGSIPDEGMDGFNPQAYMQELARKGQINNGVARYQMLQDHVELVFPNFTQTWQYPGASTIQGVINPLCRCNGARFSGVYAWGQYMLQFAPDGTFFDRGAIDTVALMNPRNPRAGQGSYRIQNNTLYLDYSDGRRFRTSFAAPAAQEGGPTFDWIAVRQQTGRRVQ